MMKKNLIIGLLIVSSSLFSQEDKPEKLFFSLEEAQDYAIENNYKNKMAFLDIDIAKKKIWETTAIGLPQINVEGKLQKFIDIPISLAPAKSFNPSAGADELTELQFGLQYNNSIAINATQLLFDGSYIVGLQAAKVYKKLSINNQIKTELELLESVNQAYFTVLVAEENTSILKKSLSSVKKILYETEIIYKEGLIDEQSVDQLTLSVNQLKTSVDIGEGQIDFARKLLNLQLGVDVEQQLILTEEIDFFVRDISSKEGGGFLDIERNIDYNIVKTNLHLMKLNLRKEKYSFLPSVNLFFNHQQQNMNNTFDAFGGGKWYPTTIIGASLRLPILTSGSRLAKISQAKIELEKIEISAKEIEQGLIYKSQVSESSYETNYEVYQNQKENMALAKKIYNKTLIKYKEGVSSSLELSQTQNQYLNAEGKYIKALLDVLTAKSEMQKSYGTY